MKKHNFFLLLFVILLHFTPCAYTETPKELFSQANQQYKSGKFKRAMELYKKIPNKSALVNYNLGNCAYKLKKYGYAMLYWRRAEKNWGFFNRRELIDNITLLEQNIQVKSGFPRKIKNFILSWIRAIPLFLLQLIFLFLWLFIFVYLRFLYKKRKKNLIISLFSLIAILGMIIVIRYSLEARIYGVVINRQTALLSGPGSNFQTLQQIPEAQQVIIKKESGEYYKIKVYKRIGWTHQKDIEKI
jgi:tetratricopeptide (TPR) repeat protein